MLKVKSQLFFLFVFLHTVWKPADAVWPDLISQDVWDDQWLYNNYWEKYKLCSVDHWRLIFKSLLLMFAWLNKE